MPLATNIDAAKRYLYQQSVTMVAQQMGSPLNGAVTEVDAKGEAQSVTDLLGVIKAQTRQPRDASNVENPGIFDRVWLFQPTGIVSGQHVFKEDEFAMAHSPASDLLRAHVAAVRRGIHDTILGISEDTSGYLRVTGRGIFGTISKGKTPGAGTAFSGTTQPVNATGLTVAKLQAAVKQMRKDDFGMEDSDELHACITASQMDDLLTIAAASSAALNAFNIDQLRSGKPTSLLGITWHYTNRLPLKAGGTNTRLIPIWSKKNVVVGKWQDLQGDMWLDSSKSNTPYMQVQAFVDATRIQDKGVAIIECLES